MRGAGERERINSVFLFAVVLRSLWEQAFKSRLEVMSIVSASTYVHMYVCTYGHDQH